MKTRILRKQSREEYNCRHLIGNGIVYSYRLGDEQGRLTLTFSDSPFPERYHSVQCANGVLHFSALEPVLNLLADCPGLLLQQVENDWYWPLFNQAISSDLDSLFGGLCLIEDINADRQVILNLQLSVGQKKASSLLSLSINTLTLLIHQPGWRANTLTINKGFNLTYPLTLARVSLSNGQLQAIKAGDFILFTTSHIATSGQGEICLGNMRLRGKIQSDRQSVKFAISHVDSSPVLHNEDPSYIAFTFRDEVHPMEDNTFSELPLELTVRCGTFTITLEELKKIGVGSSLLISQSQIDQATLYYQDTALARGELVDIEGSLGLQIKLIMPGWQHNESRDYK
ncbi:MAG: FliM/FliN family flagellar motor switch protein [Rouxiella aceris]|uniref:FliM/FliN family flagellar motor switch protein n=1 Tax=Rouxiella aceris TaxID=2703884 RepID=UPI00283C71D6|nr:FliM/FliN family flagellar motor switch protein [Rouxiella aceris]MDR3431849.1 FliM/FliN family flagellar motor switch protein [Rouxiella aceris]